MTTDLFQGLTVGLLAAIAILLIAAIATLARLGSTLRSVAQSRSDALAGHSREVSAEAAPVGAVAPSEVAVATEPAPTADTAAVPDQGRADLTDSSAPDAGHAEFPDAASAEAGRAVETRPAAEAPWDEEAARVRQEEAAAAEAQPEPAAEEEPSEQRDAAASASARETESAAGAVEEEPQEQPFERDGRWWFRRGEELLVYDEQTGQWLQAPGPTAGAAGLSEAEPRGSVGAVATETRTSSLGDQEPAAEQSSGGFWKCPACGAVNGSTATSCRMCFTARPS